MTLDPKREKYQISILIASAPQQLNTHCTSSNTYSSLTSLPLLDILLFRDVNNIAMDSIMGILHFWILVQRLPTEIQNTCKNT
jgi:hypothetical protein